MQHFGPRCVAFKLHDDHDLLLAVLVVALIRHLLGGARVRHLGLRQVPFAQRARRWLLVPNLPGGMCRDTLAAEGVSAAELERPTLRAADIHADGTVQLGAADRARAPRALLHLGLLLQAMRCAAASGGGSTLALLEPGRGAPHRGIAPLHRGQRGARRARAAAMHVRAETQLKNIGATWMDGRKYATMFA